MTPRVALVLPLAFLAAGAGCLDASVAPPAGAGQAWAVLPPVTLTAPGSGAGFEPSIEAAPDGTLFATAAKGARSSAIASGQLADWAWWSGDGGRTWQAAESPQNRHRAMVGLEGDAAVDAAGFVYYADTFGPDYFLHVWSTEGPGLEWERSLPLPTGAFLDDRPWLAAHGEGILYLISNTGPEGPVLGDLLEGDASMSSKWLFRSEDGGLTWTPGQGLGPAAFCEVAASPADDRTAWIGCSDGTDAGAPFRLLESTDRGATWDVVFRGVHEQGHGYLSAVPAVDRSGMPALAWLDDRVDWSSVNDIEWGGDAPGKVYVARPDALGAWQVRDVTPFAGRFGVVHACAGADGHVAVIFFATPDLTPDDATEWTAHMLLFDDIDEAEAAPHLLALLDEPAAVGAIPPRDLFQCAIDPFGTVHTAVQRNRDEANDPGDGIRADVLHVAARRSLPS